MNLLASDYDGTFKSDNKTIYINISAVDKFRKNGNKFVIATGRSFDSIKNEIYKYNIKYDYLICNNGLIIFDDKNNIISQSILNNDIVFFLYSRLCDSKNLKEIKLYNLYSSTEEMIDILEIYAKFKNIKSAKIYKEQIESIIPSVSCYRDNNKLFIGNTCSKKDALLYIQKLENIDKENIYTVGDNQNDIEMLEGFNGYKMLYSYPNMWFNKIPITKEVYTLIKKINSKEKHYD